MLVIHGSCAPAGIGLHLSSLLHKIGVQEIANDVFGSPYIGLRGDERVVFDGHENEV
jgi:hypothetical protein